MVLVGVGLLLNQQNRLIDALGKWIDELREDQKEIEKKVDDLSDEVKGLPLKTMELLRKKAPHPPVHQCEPMVTRFSEDRTPAQGLAFSADNSTRLNRGQSPWKVNGWRTAPQRSSPVDHALALPLGSLCCSMVYLRLDDDGNGQHESELGQLGWASPVPLYGSSSRNRRCSNFLRIAEKS